MAARRSDLVYRSDQDRMGQVAIAWAKCTMAACRSDLVYRSDQDRMGQVAMAWAKCTMAACRTACCRCLCPRKSPEAASEAG